MKEENEKEIFLKENFEKMNLNSKKFFNCSFESCNFTESNLGNTHFIDCYFKNCIFVQTDLRGCRLQNSKFIESKLIGVNFSVCNKLMFSPKYLNCIIRVCSFSDLKLNNSMFNRSEIIESRFNRNSLTNTDFTGCNFIDSDFNDNDLSGANFKDAKGYNISPLQNKIKLAKFSYPEVLSLLTEFKIEIIN